MMVIKTQKKVYIIVLVAFALGIIVGGAIQYKRLIKSMDTRILYSNNSPTIITITEKEIEAKETLYKLLAEYGEVDRNNTDLTVEETSRKVNDIFTTLLPEDSQVEYCKRAGGDIEVYYQLEGIFYHLLYLDQKVQKCITVNYNNKEYCIINTDNQEFDCTRIN
ncbi:MAG: hypothetical protein Q4F05_10265 [bacterium]|nr:hypothetical protein [bacterium]